MFTPLHHPSKSINALHPQNESLYRCAMYYIVLVQ